MTCLTKSIKLKVHFEIVRGHSWFGGKMLLEKVQEHDLFTSFGTKKNCSRTTMKFPMDVKKMTFQIAFLLLIICSLPFDAERGSRVNPLIIS